MSALRILCGYEGLWPWKGSEALGTTQLDVSGCVLRDVMVRHAQANGLEQETEGKYTYASPPTEANHAAPAPSGC